ncbi:MAG: FAD-dependent oxidoreductase [Chloroflexota bacterium]
MSSPGTADNPLRVAIIGSGPSGFYAADALLKNKDGIVVEVDMFERLLTPFGLVRGGVAPDHQKIKNVTKIYERTAAHENFRFYGNVEFGRDISHAEMIDRYHQIVYAVGAQTDKQLGIPGEDLAGSHAATEFVAWYNGHPDYRHLTFDLSHETAIVIGNGNVAMDVTRILASSPEELARTDIADYALEALRHSKVKRIVMLGRRGIAQAAFTNPELKEFGELEDAQVIVSEEDVTLDPLSTNYLTDSGDRSAEKNVSMLQQYYETEHDPDKSKEIIMRFLVSPVKFDGDGKVEHVEIVHNELYLNERGTLRPRATEQHETIEAGIVFRSIGYRGVPLPDVPFFDKWGIIPNVDGRVTDTHEGEFVPGDYAVGWIKRGPSGIIGTNKPDSIETVRHMLEDLAEGKHYTPTQTTRAAVEDLLKERDVRYVTFADWQKIDEIEVSKGEAAGRPRVKFTNPAEMLALLESSEAQPSGD